MFLKLILMYLLSIDCHPIIMGASAAKVGLVVRDLPTRTVTTALADGTNVTQLVRRPIALMGTDCSDTATTEAPLVPNTVFVSGWAAATNLGTYECSDSVNPSAARNS